MLRRLRYTDHALDSDGAVDAYRPVLLDGTGKLDTTFLPGLVTAAGSDGILRMAPSASNTVDNDGTLTLNAAFTGFLFVMNSTDANIAIFGCDTTSTYEIADPEAQYAAAAGTATSTNIYVSGGNVILQNKRGASRTYHIILFGTSGAF